MNRLIRANDLRGRVRSLALGTPAADAPAIAPVDARDLERQALVAERDALAQALADARARIEELGAEAMDAEARAREAGHAAGLAAAADGTRERLSRLEEGVAQALARQGDQLRILEHMAVVVAQAGLRKVLGPGSAKADLVAEIIAVQARGLADESILAVEVSALDFGDPGDLEALAATCPGLELKALDLPSGACRLKLRLGRLEADLDDQWAALDAILRDLAAPEAGA